ncbi:MAG: hypothetical protein AB9856_09025 [Cellulosilyticaceae bacterium]
MKDTYNLRDRAIFEISISKDLYWVPVNLLGKTRYLNKEIQDMVNLKPEEKRNLINNVYEALQLYQASGFFEVDDPKYIEENGYIWEHHKPGYDAILTNCGCCATNSSWLNYLIDGKYEEIGLLAYSRPNGTGHVMNCIYHDKWYYIIDLLPHQKKYQQYFCKESGIKRDFFMSKYFTGNLMRCRNLQSYVRFFQRIQMYNGFEHLFFYQKSLNAHPVSTKENDRYITIIYPQNNKIINLSNDLKTIKHCFVEEPKIIPSWK